MGVYPTCCDSSKVRRGYSDSGKYIMHRTLLCHARLAQTIDNRVEGNYSIIYAQTRMSQPLTRRERGDNFTLQKQQPPSPPRR